MTSTIYYNFLNDLPKLPLSLVLEVYRSIDPKFKFYNRNGISKYSVTENLSNWLEENVLNKLDSTLHIGSSAVSKTGIAIQKITKEYQHNPPHTDGAGELVLFYFLSLGGDAVQTIWYREEGQSLVRSLGIKETDSASLFEVHRVIIPESRWVMLTSNIFHGVDNIQDDRVSISIRLIRDTAKKV